MLAHPVDDIVCPKIKVSQGLNAGALEHAQSTPCGRRLDLVGIPNGHKNSDMSAFFYVFLFCPHRVITHSTVTQVQHFQNYRRFVPAMQRPVHGWHKSNNTLLPSHYLKWSQENDSPRPRSLAISRLNFFTAGFITPSTPSTARMMSSSSSESTSTRSDV